MIFVFRLDFDHDWPDKTVRFEKFTEAVVDKVCFDVTPVVVEQPVFSYGHWGVFD